MKTYRLVSLGLLLSLLLQPMLTSLMAQGGTEKVLVKSFQLEGLPEVVLHASGPVEVRRWQSDVMRVQMTVYVEQATETMVKSLVQAGRYNIRTEALEGRWSVTTPGLQREVLRNGQPLQERISYLVFLPDNTHLTVKSDSSASANANGAL
jgi:hypothetical protein